jgi:hypothetical protein
MRDTNYITETLMEFIVDNPLGPNKLYNDGMLIIQEIAVEKNISFDATFRETWGLEPEVVMTFDDHYFENVDQRMIYVFFSAARDQDINDAVAYLWQIVTGEVFTEAVLVREIQFLLEKGVKF